MVPRSQMETIMKQMGLMQETITSLQRQTSLTEVTMQAQLQLGALGGSSKKAKPDDRPLTENEKEVLKAGINGLAPEKLPRVVEIIKERMANVDERDHEIEIDLDALDHTTLRHLQRYVKV